MTCRMVRCLLVSAIVLQSLSVVARDRSLEMAVPEEGRQTLEFPLRAGDYIRLHQVDGDRISGRVDDFDDHVVSVDGRSFSLSRGEVDQIELRVDDSLTDGALYGAAGAAAYIAFACGASGGCESDGATWTSAAVIVGAGAGLGALIDSFHHGYETVYPAPTDETTWNIAPLIDRDKKGVVFTLSF